jgi:hypothetical protein
MYINTSLRQRLQRDVRPGVITCAPDHIGFYSQLGERQRGVGG